MYIYKSGGIKGPTIYTGGASLEKKNTGFGDFTEHK